MADAFFFKPAKEDWFFLAPAPVYDRERNLRVLRESNPTYSFKVEKMDWAPAALEVVAAA